MEYYILASRCYIKTFDEFISLRPINKKCADIFIEYMAQFKFNELTYSKRTWIQINKCQTCNCFQDNCRQLNYTVDNPPRRCIVTCSGWKCRLISLQTKLNELFSKDKLLFFEPAFPRKSYNIPRTNTNTKTRGVLFPFYNNVSLLKDNGEFYIFVKWQEEEKSYTKLVNFHDFILYNPQLKNTTFKIRKIYKNLISEEILYSFPKAVTPTS